MNDTDPPSTTPAPPASPPPAPPTAPTPRRRRWPLWLLASWSFYLAGTALMLALAIGPVWWLLFTADGARFVLARVPQLQAEGIAGSLLGGLSAERVELPLAGEDSKLRLQGLRWTALRLRPAAGGVWLRIGIDELRAQRVDLQPDSGPSKPSQAPASLALPVGLDVGLLRIDEFHMAGLDTPLRDLRARLALGADDGATHKVDALQVAWDKLRLTGSAQVATGGTLALEAALSLSQQPGAQGEWQAELKLTGPLASPQLQAQLRAQTAPARPAQTLDASATLRPFAPWPLGDLQASARALDLSALHSDAPRTALDLDASALTEGRDLPAQIELTLANRDAGRWNEGRLPLRALTLQLKARPDDPSRLDVTAFDAELGSARAPAGRLRGSGQWAPDGWRADTRLIGLRPTLIDARAPDMRLDGRLQLDGSGFDAATPDAAQVNVRGQLDGNLLGLGPKQPVQVRLDARLNALRIELRELLAQSGEARATLSGRAVRRHHSAGWALTGRGTLREFDPLPWWPGREDSPWRKGPHRLNAGTEFDLVLPAAAGSGNTLQQLTRVRGSASLDVEPSRLAGVPLNGTLSLATGADGQSRGQLQLDADGNRLRAEVKLASLADGRDDLWDLKAEAPTLKKLQPLWKLLLPTSADARLAGKLQADAKLYGRWPALATQGQLQAGELQFGTLQVQRADARWNLGTRSDSPLEAQVDLALLSYGAPSAETLTLKLKGTPAAHTLQLDAFSKALPPLWVEALQPGAANAQPAKRTLARLQLQGGLLGAAPADLIGWRGKVLGAELRGDNPDPPAWLSLSEFGFELRWADGPWRLKADPGRAALLGAALTWTQLAWSAADPGRAPARLDADARLEPLDVAPLLVRAQPRFGWGGDLRIGGQLVVHSSPTFSADLVIERSSGDLSVTDDAGTRTLGLSDLRVGLSARDGLWNFSTGIAGQTLGRAAGAVVVRSTPQAIWPAADAKMDGVLDLQIADLGVWGPWLPPGWRLTGAMGANAAIGGRFGAPEYEGALSGKNIGVRNVLQGVDVRDGEFGIALLGDSARIERFTANAGKGSLNLQGSASLGAAPRAELGLRLERFQLLGRIDRRIVASGDATLKLGRDSVALGGDFRIDEGLIDFGRSEAPRLSDDVQVKRGEAEGPTLVAATPAEAEAAAARARRTSLDLRVQLGEQLRIRGQGLDAGLRGELRLTAPQGRLRVDGSVRTVDGTYRAYRQRLNIERGVLTFNGPIDNPQLDIEAVRPNLDVRVGVAVGGTVLVPRIRLFSEPDMSDADKLSWLLRGRASDGPGSGDTALLQAAAMALLAGDEPTVLDQLFNVIGLDDISLRQSDTVAGGTIVSVGKQLSRNWYVGYERGLNATTGNWQLIYRVAQRFTIRAQSGEQNSIELIWSWRWN